MLFQELKRLARSWEVARDLTPEGYARKRVRYLLRLDGEGRPRGVIDLASGTTGAERRGREIAVPHAVRSAATRPLLLADGPDYLFGVDPDPTKASRASARRQAFLDLIMDCARHTGRAELDAVHAYLSSNHVPDDLDLTADIVTFEVDGVQVVELPEVRRFWASLQRESKPSAEVQCLVCGQLAPCAEVWPVLIKGIPGGQSSGNQLVSANAQAFESYGLEGSRTSPACLECAAEIGKALNWLIEHDDHHLRMPNGIFVFWTREEEAFHPANLLSDPDPAEVAELLSSPWTGRSGATELREPDFFAAELSASGSRVVIRSWIETTVPDAKRHLATYFRRQAVVQWDGSAPGPLPVGALVRATCRELRRALPFAAHDLVEIALTGRPAPAHMLAAAVRRNQAERRVTTARAALTRLALLATTSEKEAFMTDLDAGNTNPAYLCGRLLAELEATQRAAQGAATIIDRYYGAASSSPATVFGPLLRNAQHHLAKLRRDKKGAYLAIDARLTDILEPLQGSFPGLLTVKDQAVFGLGYYHQKAADRAAARARKELAETVDSEEEQQA